MKNKTLLITGLAGVLALSGCVTSGVSNESNAGMNSSSGSVKKSELIKVSGVGYGAESTFEGYTPGQRRLMAIRASKLDAYRALAEQLYGIKIDSNTSVATLTAKNDSFRARVNSVVRGARIVSVTPMADQNYETVLEVYVNQKFFQEAFVYGGSNSSSSDTDSNYNVSSY